RALDLVVVAAAAFAYEGRADVVPDFLRLDQHAVQVEDDRLDHRRWYVLSRYMSALFAGPCSMATTSPMKKVWSPASCSERVRASSQPTAPSMSGATVPSRIATPSQCTIGGRPEAKRCASS